MSQNGRIFDGFDEVANPNHNSSAFIKAMDSHLKRTCDNAKNDGVQIYSIAFDVPNGSSVKEMMLYCASPKPGGKLYYDVSDNAALIHVFQQIAEEIAEPGLTK